MADRLIGSKPRPRVLVDWEFADLATEIEKLAPTVLVAAIGSVNANEWDCVIASPSLHLYADHLSVVSIGPPSSGRYVDRIPRGTLTDPTAASTITIAKDVISTEFVIPGALDAEPELLRLVADKLIPAVRNAEQHTPYIGFQQSEIEPFLLTRDGDILAGRYHRGVSAEAWLLPVDTPDMPSWIAAALRRWHDLWPERFPRSLLDWESDPSWRTRDESLIADELTQIERERVDFEARSLVLRCDGERRLAEATEVAARGARLLLTGRGDELVNAVEATLQYLGFDVENVDATRAPGDRVEDLRVRDTDAPGWVAIVEIRSLTGGAAAGDVSRLARFARKFHAETGAWPSARWYGVNQFVGQDPSLRPPMLHSNPDELAAFATEDEGLAFDTSVLFTLRKAVEEGTLDATEARRLLRDGRGRFSL